MNNALECIQQQKAKNKSQIKHIQCLLYATLLRFSFSNKSKRKAQIESRMDKSETKATHDTEQRETTIKK